uniref:FLYWCH-type domain-containing protein n=1 Tax=Anopheles atroparvus TaxID=41427 RepID=A0A182IN43_ANOAO
MITYVSSLYKSAEKAKKMQKRTGKWSESQQVDSTEYGYNLRGNLVYDNFSYSKASINGMANIIYWRCTEYRKRKCRASLKTKGKDLFLIDAIHNHEPKNYGRILPASLPIFNDTAPETSENTTNE